VTSISYNTGRAAGVASTPAVTLSYDSAGELADASIGNQYTESYTFDDDHRVSSVTRWILGQISNSGKAYTTGYEYNGGTN
jgi:hypothetical protein